MTEQAETGTVIIPLSGEIDVATIGDVRASVVETIARGASHVVFDVSALTFIDSTGLALFAQTTLKVDRVTIRGASPLIQRLIHVTGLDDVLHVDP